MSIDSDTNVKYLQGGSEPFEYPEERKIAPPAPISAHIFEACEDMFDGLAISMQNTPSEIKGRVKSPLSSSPQYPDYVRPAGDARNERKLPTSYPE